jgi:hypothetical protein
MMAEIKHKSGYIYLKVTGGTYRLDYNLYTQKDPNWVVSFEYDWDEWMRQSGYNPIPDETQQTKSCFHDWKEYCGFTDKYWYCEKCDVKSKEDPNLIIKF